jgi:16S rRNA (adenine1518-N6/adenine1519-N6)-dimethyltransferase
MKLSEMKHILAERDLQLTKSLGQNFLHDGNQLRRIVEAAELTRADRVLEIGPGLGPLTELLLAQAGEVLAIEKDARLVTILRERFASVLAATGEPPPPARFELLHDDALDYLQREPRDWGDWKLVANLPYAVASPILVELAQSTRGPQCMINTLQLEVGRRLMAKPGQDDYGVLTLLIQLNYEPREWFKIPASCFFPEPEVDSACVCLARRRELFFPADRQSAFSRIVKRSFSQRRKMMLKLLKPDWPEPQLRAAFGAAAIPLQARAETVGLEQFVRLTNYLHE